MKTFSLLIVLFLVYSIIAFAQDTSFAVSSNGNVGIGTSTPGAKLEVNSGSDIISTRFTTSSNFSGVAFHNSSVDSDKVIIGSLNGELMLITNGTGRIVIKNDGKVGIGLFTPSEQLSVGGNITVLGTVDGVDISNFKLEFDQLISDYVYNYQNLNSNPVNLDTTWTKVNTTSGSHSFTKSNSDSKIEVHVNSRFRGGMFNFAGAVFFQVRIDDTNTPDFDNLGSIITTSTEDFLSLYAVFENLPAGTHTVSIWGKTFLGTSTGVMVDPHGYGGAIIVKETW